MKKIMVYGIASLIALSCIAQQRELDSLLTAYNNYQKEDTVKLKILLDIVFDYSYINAEKGLEKANEAIALAQKLNNGPKLASAYNYKGINYEARGDNQSALECYGKALETRKKLADTIGIAKVLHNIGIVHFNLADYTKALQCQNESLGIFERLHYSKGIAGDINSIGVIYLTIADYPKALESYFKSLKIQEALNNKPEIAIAYNNIGLVYNHLSDYEKALQYLFKSLKIYEEQGDNNNMQKALGNIGNCYNEANNPEKALTYYQKALDISESAKFLPGIASAYSNMGIVYNKLHDYPKSLQCSQKALLLYRQLGNKLGIENCLSQLGQTYLLSPVNNEIKNDKYDKAAGYFNEVQRLAKETGTLEMEDDSWEQLSKVYTKQKKFDKALDAYKKYIDIRDSIINDDKKQEITHHEMQYEFDKQQVLLKAEEDKKHALAMAEIGRQKIIKNAVTGGASVLLLAACISFVFYKRRRDADTLKRDAEFKAQVSDTEMKALRSQMNPHFIFNSLNSIGDYISKNNLQAADNYLTKFAKLMRSVLENSEQKEIPLADDLKALELYMQLESLRLENKFTYEIHVDENIDKENTLIPPLILQPFVENSIWHGIAKKQGQGKISISIKTEGGMISCVVEDDGIGLQQSSIPNREKKSFGMKITGSRIDILNKTKKANASIKLSGLQQGTRAEVKLPLQLSF